MQPTKNARGGINKQSSREKEGLVNSGSTGIGSDLVQPEALAMGSTVAPGMRTADIGSNVVPVDAMEQGGEALDIPQVTVDESVVGSTVANAQTFATDQQAALAKELEAEQGQTDLVKQLMAFTSGRGGERATAIQEAGIPEAQKELADLVTRIGLNTEELAAFDDETFLGEESLRAEGASRDITKNVFSAQARERRLQRAIDRTGKAAQLRAKIATAELLQNNITAATEQIDASLEAKYAPAEQALQNEMFFLQRQWQKSDTAEQRVYQAKMNVVEQQQREISDAKDMVLNAMPYATPAELAEMTAEGISPQEQFKLAQEVTARGMREDRYVSLYGTGGGEQSTDMITEAANLILQADPSSGNVREVLSQLMQDKSIPASIRNNIGTVFDVAGSLENFALANPEGEFAGLGLGGGISGAILSPFVFALGSEDYKESRTANRSSIEAINLKVQQWASGAALTEAQTQQVEKITPRQGDSDGEVRRKTNALFNFMMDVTETQLVTAGYNVRFPSVDMFEMAELVSQMSPEQKAVFDDYQKEFGYNTLTQAYGTQ